MDSEEKVIFSTLGTKELFVLDPNGDPYSSFKLPGKTYGLYQHGNNVFASLFGDFVAYDYFGKRQWQLEDFSIGNDTPMACGENGFYIVNYELREEVDVPEALHKVEVLGETIYESERSQTDLWFANIGFDGNIRWHKFIQEKTTANSPPVTYGQRVVLPYQTEGYDYSNNLDTNTGFHILDLEGKILQTVQRPNIYPESVSLLGNTLVYEVLEVKKEEDKKFKISARYLEGLNLDTLDTEFSIPFEEKGFMIPLKKSNNRLWVNCRGLTEIDLRTQELRRYISLPGDYRKIHALDHIFVAEPSSDSPKGQERFTTYDKGLRRLWEFPLPEYISFNYRTRNLHGNSILVSNFGNLLKLNSDGKVDWTFKIPGHIKSLSQVI